MCASRSLLLALFLALPSLGCGGSGGGSVPPFESGESTTQRVADLGDPIRYCEDFQAHYDAVLDTDTRYDWFCRPQVVINALAGGLTREECEAELAACPDNFQTPQVAGVSCFAFRGTNLDCQVSLGEFESCVTDQVAGLGDLADDADCRLADLEGAERLQARLDLLGGAEVPSSCSRLVTDESTCRSSVAALEVVLNATARP